LFQFGVLYWETQFHSDLQVLLFEIVLSFFLKWLMMCMLQELHIIWYFIIIMLYKFEGGEKFSLSFAVQHCMSSWEGFYMFV
jgi:hypothetical protein